MNQKTAWKWIRELLLIILGNALTASASAFFIVPNDLVVGGTTGIGVLVGQFFPHIKVSFVVFVLNVFLFLLGFLFLGKKFALTTLLGTFLFPGFIAIFEFMIGDHVLTEDKMLASLMSGLLIGAGIGIVVRVGSSTGGFDIPPLILHKLFSIPVSISIWTVDVIIIIVQCFILPIENALYGIFMAVFYSFLIDRVSVIGQKKIQVNVISRKFEEIRLAILDDLNRGATILHGQTGYLREECDVIMTIIAPRELVKLKELVQKIDEEAFITISSVSEVRGRGFTMDRISLKLASEEAVKISSHKTK